MLIIPEEKIYILYEYDDVVEELTYLDILYNIIYDIKHYLGISLNITNIKEIINLDIFNKYLSYLKSSLDPHINKTYNIINNTKEMYNICKNKYYTSIPSKMIVDDFHNKLNILLDNFLNSLLEVEYINTEYYSFN